MIIAPPQLPRQPIVNSLLGKHALDTAGGLRGRYDPNPFPAKEVQALHEFVENFKYPDSALSLTSTREVWERVIHPIDPYAANMVINGINVEDFYKPGQRPRPNKPRSYHLPEGHDEMLLQKFTNSTRWKEVSDTELHQLQQQEEVIFHPAFLVKKNVPGGHEPNNPEHWREVIDCKAVNQVTDVDKIKLENLSDVAELLQPNDFMMQFDLKQGYFHIPLQPSSTAKFAVKHSNRTFLPTGMVFGWRPAPAVFTRILRGPMKILRSLGIRVVIYLDDLLLMAPRRLILQHGKIILDLFCRLGFHFNLAKCRLQPFQFGVYLGLGVDSVARMFYVPNSKVKSARNKLKNGLNQHRREIFTARALAKVIGFLVSFKMAILPTMTNLRGMLRCLAVHLRSQAFDDHIELSPEAQEDMQWWIDNIREVNGQLMIQSPPDEHYRTDASQFGWGVHFIKSARMQRFDRTGGSFTAEEQQLHINAKELLAIYFALQVAQPPPGSNVLIEADNTSAEAQVNNQGGRSQALQRISRQVWKWCHQHRVRLHIEWLPGVDNVIADQESRRAYDSADWKLHPQLFQEINHRFGPLDIDMFATRVNKQLPRFWSRDPDIGAEASDAFAQHWQHLERPYAHPPYHLIGRVLAKINKETQRIPFVMVLPIWQSRPWWALLPEMILCPPLLLPRRSNTFLPVSTNNTVGVGVPRWEAAVFLLQARRPLSSSALEVRLQWISSMERMQVTPH